MDNQDHGKNHSSGHESHGIHLCKKCGWPFPNPHPSAKHRRAHKKICGTIEGYALGDSIHSSASDDDPLSDEDHKTTITQEPKIMETRNPEKNIGGIGAISNRSEDEVFSDATMEFQDSGSGLGRQVSLDNARKADKFVEKDLTATISFKDCEDADAIQSPKGSIDNSQKEVLVVENTPTRSIGTPEQQDLGLGYSRDSDDKNSSACDVLLIKPEAPMGVSEKSSEVSAGDCVAECSVEQGTDASENDEGKFNKNLGGNLVVLSEGADELSESVPVPEKRLEVILDTVLPENTVQMMEELSDRLASTMSMSEHGKQETDGTADQAINLERNLIDVTASDGGHASVTSERREDITCESELDSKFVEVDKNTDKLALNMVIDNFSPEAQSIKHTDEYADISEMKIGYAQDTESATPVSSSDVYDKKEIENESVYVLSVPDDIPVIKEAESKLEGFKDDQGVQLPQLGVLASEELIINKKDDVKDHVSQDIYHSNKLDDDIKVDTSDKNVVEDNEAVVKEVLVEGKADVLQINNGSDALGSAVDDYTTENEKDHKVCSLDQQQLAYVSDDLREVDFSGSLINVAPDMSPIVAPADAEAEKSSNIVGDDDRGITESARTGTFDDGNYMKNTETSCQSANSFTVSQTNSASNNSDDINTRKAEKDDTNVVESGEGQEEYLSVKTDSRSESISIHQQSSVVTEEMNNEYVRTLPKIEGPHSSKVSTSQDEINRGNKVQGECTVEDVVSSALDHRGGNDSESTSEDQLKKELMHLPPDAKLTCQSGSALEDSHAIESGLDTSGISSITLQGEAENVSVKNQLDTTFVDVSVDSSSQTDSLEAHCGSISGTLASASSQTDSLEAHWGSISVLSTQSDNVAVVDTETLPSTGSHALSEADRASIKNPKAASEEHFDKSDEFDPPSFMTLVEPGAGDHKAAADSEIQTEQNGQQQSIASPLQAVWFPSLTHVANESPGRKKNEEIIAKVTNWNAKQHTPLKHLLGEAERETKPKSPNSKQIPTAVSPREENVAKDNGTKASSMAGPEAPVTQPTNMEAGEEWNSPARYPVDIKREKRKVKGRPLWVHFACCSSVN